MLSCMSGETSIYLEYPNKHGRLHEGLNNIVYLWYCIYFDSITVILKV